MPHFMETPDGNAIVEGDYKHLEENPALVRQRTQRYENLVSEGDEELEFSYNVPTDGSIVTFAPPLPNGAKTVEVMNGTDKVLNILDDRGTLYPVNVGPAVIRLVNPSRAFSCNLVAAASNMRAVCYVIFHARRMANAGDVSSSGGGSGGNVVITGPLGQALKAASLPVTLASDQGNLPENLAQVGGAAIALGQALMAASLPVVLASNQPAISISDNDSGLPFRISSVAATAANIKATAGSLIGWMIINTNAAIRYLHLYNKATAPTVGTDTPIATIALPAGAAANVRTFKIGFATGIGYAVTTDDIAIPATVGAAGDIQGTVFYL